MPHKRLNPAALAIALFIAKDDEMDELIAFANDRREAARKKYPRWRVWRRENPLN